MALESLQDLYLDKLRDLHDAENQILQALPKMSQAVQHPELKRAFQQHEEQTREHARRLQQIFSQLGQRPEGKPCEGMRGIIREGQTIMSERANSDVLDAALLAAAQGVEHYEMAGYGSARTYAMLLGREDQAELLQRTLDEEGETDHKLTDLAERVINVHAAR